MTGELLTAAEMAEADKAAIAGGIPGMTLMEAAGRAVADQAAALEAEGPVLVIAGSGNNGGDAAIAARLIQENGREVSLLLATEPTRLRGDAAEAFARWKGPTLAPDAPLPQAALIIDGLFGAGLDRPVTGAPAALVEAMNFHPAHVLAIDVPSGVDGSTGLVRGTAVRAAATVTFFRKKPGHLLYPGRDLCGEVTLAEIGIPASVLPGLSIQTWENAPGLWLAELTPPKATGHKYQRGHALVLSGPAIRTGAARLAACAALRAGAGLVTLASPADALATNAAHLTAVMLRPSDSPHDLADILDDPRFTAVALGPGLGSGENERALVCAALKSRQTVILDADGITAFAEAPERLFAEIRGREAPVILTPHEGEFGRLFPDLKPDQERSRLAATRDAAARSRATVVLKGPDTVIAAPDGRAAINANAPPWLATAGTGDVLTGIVAGLAARGLPAFAAAAAAVWLHGAAGNSVGPGLVAEDLAPALRVPFAALWT